MDDGKGRCHSDFEIPKKPKVGAIFDCCIINDGMQRLLLTIMFPILPATGAPTVRRTLRFAGEIAFSDAQASTDLPRFSTCRTLDRSSDRFLGLRHDCGDRLQGTWKDSNLPSLVRSKWKTLQGITKESASTTCPPRATVSWTRLMAWEERMTRVGVLKNRRIQTVLSGKFHANYAQTTSKDICLPL